MRDLNRYVIKKYAADWKDVGLELGLQLSTLKVVKQNNPLQAEDCLEEVLDKWLKLTPNATWRTLEVALTNVRRLQLDLDPVHNVYDLDSVDNVYHLDSVDKCCVATSIPSHTTTEDKASKKSVKVMVVILPTSIDDSKFYT